MKFLKMVSELSIGKVVIMALFVAAAYYVSYFDTGATIEAQVAAINALIDTEITRRSEIEKTMKKEEEMRGSVLQLARNLEVVKSKIPNEFKDAQMSAIINSAAQTSNVRVVALGATDSQKPDNAPPREVNMSDLKPENLIEEVKFSIEIHGTFDAFLKFLDTITKEDKVIKIRNFSISRLSEDVEETQIKFKSEIIGFKQANIKILPGPK